jgi:TonB-dependent SusC/RagA subfamily outer membrane receptor
MEIYLFLLKMNLVLGAYYLLYRIFLQPLTFFNLNRIFLVASLILSVIASFCSNTQKTIFLATPPELSTRLVTTPSNIVHATTIDWAHVGIVIYWTGGFLMAVLLIVRLLSLMLRYTVTPKETCENIPIRRLQGNTSPFSFFGSIFLNPSLYSHTELVTILKHEEVHVRQIHSADILLGEIARVFCWFNPFAWMISNAIRKNLEFIADRQVLQEGIDRRKYQYSLLATFTGQSAVSFPNHFNFSHLKTRIHMMNKQKSNKTHLMKYLLAAALSIITLLFATGLSFAQQQKVITHNRQTEQSTSSKPGMPVVHAKNQPISTMKQEKAVQRKAKKALVEKEVGDNNADSIAKLLMRQPALSSVNAPMIMQDNRKISTVDFLQLDSSKVVSISVLKGDAAIAAYGEDGKNGVILITSK